MSNNEKLRAYIMEQLADPRYASMGAEEFIAYVNSSPQSKRRLSKLGYNSLPGPTCRLIRRIKKAEDEDVFDSLDQSFQRHMAKGGRGIISRYIERLKRSEDIKTATEEHIAEMNEFIKSDDNRALAIETYYSDESIARLITSVSVPGVSDDALSLLRSGASTEMHQARSRLKMNGADAPDIRNEALKTVRKLRGVQNE